MIEVFKTATEPRARTDYRPLLNGEWHLLDFGTQVPGVIENRGCVGRLGEYTSKVVGLYSWARRHKRYAQTRTEPAPEHGERALRMYVRLLDREKYWALQDARWAA